MRKTLYPGLLLFLITSASYRQSAQQRTTMVGESWHVSTKRVLIKTHNSGIMCENLGKGARPSTCPLCRRPWLYWLILLELKNKFNPTKKLKLAIEKFID